MAPEIGVWPRGLVSRPGAGGDGRRVDRRRAMRVDRAGASRPPGEHGISAVMPDRPTIDAMRRNLPAAERSPDQVYSLLTSSIVPRPIAWVSTRSLEGMFNLAPYSFFTVASQDPAIVSVTSVGHKDTLANVRSTGEFVVNIGSEHLIDQINESSGAYPRDFDEFEAFGLTPEDSEYIDAPRVAEAAIAIECALHDLHEVGNGTLILGKVVNFSIFESVLAEDGLPLIDKVRPPSRLGRTEWGLAPEVTERERPQVK